MHRLAVSFVALGLFAAALPALAQKKPACVVDRKPLAKGATEIQVNRKRTALCSAKCAAAFRKTPEKYLEKVSDCPVLHNPVAKITSEGRLVVNNSLYYFCCAGCKDGFLQSPQHLKKLEDVVTGEVFTVGDSSPRVEHQGQHYLFATEASKTTFEKSPEKYAHLFGKP